MPNRRSYVAGDALALVLDHLDELARRWYDANRESSECRADGVSTAVAIMRAAFHIELEVKEN